MAVEHLVRIIVRPYTAKKYRGYIRNHFDIIGRLPVDTISHTDMIKWTKHMMSKGKAPKTIRNVHGFISHVMRNDAEPRTHFKEPLWSYRLPKDRGTKFKTTFLTITHPDPTKSPDQNGRGKTRQLEISWQRFYFLASTIGPNSHPSELIRQVVTLVHENHSLALGRARAV